MEEGGEPLKWAVPVWWDFCREFKMQKNRLTIEIRNFFINNSWSIETACTFRGISSVKSCVSSGGHCEGSKEENITNDKGGRGRDLGISRDTILLRQSDRNC